MTTRTPAFSRVLYCVPADDGDTPDPLVVMVPTLKVQVVPHCG